MTGAPIEEYVTDVPYLRAFVRDLSPLMLRLVAALNGFPSPPGDDFDYCELGSAHGDTTATLAAAYPGGRFLGVDINPDHIASARHLAAEGELDNVRFLERDFEDLATDEIADLDFVTAHGVVSWVGPAKRKALLELASRRLKHGGLLYVSYNALPGWASVEPLRQLMLDRGAAVGGSSIERARAGLAFAKMLRDAGAAYFSGNPAAREMLTTMERMGLPYIVHEYLHAHWVPMYFTQLASEMAAHDLYFVGQLPLYLNYRDLAIPASLAGVFKSVGDRVTFESLKDYATNQFFRRDVFVKGKVQRDEAAAAAFLDSTPFGTLIGEGALTREARLPHHTLHFVGEIFDALLPALAAGATTVADLARRPALAPFGQVGLRDAIVRLLLGGQVSPTMNATRAATAPAGELRIASAYNRMMLRERFTTDDPIVLASPVAGTGIPLPVLEALTLRLVTEIPEPEWPEWVGAFVRREPFRLKVGERAVQDDEARIRVLLAQVAPFRAKRLPRLIELGIVERA
jgi:SAM-dependent methyltransferase